MDGVPDALRRRDFPDDRIGGVPLVRVLRPNARDKLARAKQERRNQNHLLAQYGLWGVSGDPNFADFHTLYVANSGVVIHIGEVRTGCLNVCDHKSVIV